MRYHNKPWERSEESTEVISEQFWNPFSVHTFYFVFSYSDKEEFIKNISNTDAGYWKEQNSVYENEKLSDYQAYQYFYPQAREILGISRADEGGATDTKIYASKLVKHPADSAPDEHSKIIITYKEEDKEKNIELILDDIHLFLFDNQIGIVSYEAEYYSEDRKDWEQNVRTIKYINEYFRRIFPEYIAKSTESEEKYFCALQPLAVELKNLNTTFNEGCISEKYSGSDSTVYEKYLKKKNSLSPIVYNLFGENEEGCNINPILDDRMFVCSIICSSGYSEYLMNNNGEKYAYEFDENVGRDVYELIMIDKAGGCCVQDQNMRNQDLDKALYRRWMGWKTLHAITNYSMVCVTGDMDAVLDGVVNPFLRLYTRMAMIVLLQRASLIKFKNELGASVNKISTEAPSDDNLNELSSLSLQFADFQGKYLMPEVTWSCVNK